MFTCKACLRRAFASLINPSPRPYRTSTIPRPIYVSTQSRRHKTTYAEAGAPVETTKQDEAPGKDLKLQRVSQSQDWAAQKQLQYLKDPLYIAQHVSKTLEKDNFEEAALVTRKASRNTKVIVSWNHLIDYQLRHDKLHAGIKLYNEMKKRAQLPNAQTFTIIFRGMAKSSHPKLAVSEAVKIYNTMLTSTSRMKPNTIHMNAVLQVCAKAQDIDSMFSIAATANDGLRAPNNLTYTTILNALQASVNKPDYRSLQDFEVTKAKTRVIQQAKAVWQEVISKWRAGSVIIDEELVCAMGRVLLLGDYYDADSLEALVEQTMMIPRDDKVEALQLKSPKDTESLKGTNIAVPPPVKAVSQKIQAPGAPAIGHALPGNNSLSMILLALERTGKTTKIQKYWDIFTKERNVVPDADNWHQLIKVLRRGKNSLKTVSYLRDMPAKLMVPKNFRTAMSTCIRDNLNRSSFDHATEVLEIMQAKLRLPDMQVLQQYLRVAYANKRHFVEQSKDEQAGMMAWGKQIATALDNIWKPYMIMSRHCENDGPESDLKQQLIALARKMIAAYDRVIFSKIVPPEVEEQIKPKRSGLNRVVVRHFEQMREIDPHFRLKDEEDEGEDFTKQFRQRHHKSEKRPAAEGR
ncbi:hypothetical protein F4821DRAFT_224529 [Hypoxylon rubiginosum]|uniref:Uncharacterized protein n=1 Tax=Hypoxylon rubiginosum TaxID=110542 RepID=A0ACC0DII4_9PEZI|nr:hypothetical protein F4821DRAFT_224529 [Hypoxylon rubiginosum]